MTNLVLIVRRLGAVEAIRADSIDAALTLAVAAAHQSSTQLLRLEDDAGLEILDYASLNALIERERAPTDPAWADNDRAVPT